MSKNLRLTVVGMVVLALAGLFATFAPTEKAGADCGTWVSPAYTDEDMAELGEAYDDLDTTAMIELGMGDDVAELAADARGIAAAKIACDDALSTRRNISVALFGALVLLPILTMFLGGREPEIEDEYDDDLDDEDDVSRR